MAISRLGWCMESGRAPTNALLMHATQIVDLEEVVLPGNARLFHHDNECFDWGTLGWIMSAGMVDIQDYKYFIMVNSSVRGPYAPPYQPVRGLFFYVFTTLPAAHAASAPWHLVCACSQCPCSAIPFAPVFWQHKR